MIVFACPGCSKKLSVKEAAAGKKAKCPQCGQLVAIPEAASSAVAGAGKTSLPPNPPPLRPPNPKPNRPAEVTVGAASASSSEEETLAPRSAPPDAADRELYDFLAPPQAPDEIGRLGPYRVLKVLGAGGMGVVFHAEDPHLERPVALKAMKPSLAASDSARKRFLREAKAAASIKHDHIVTIFQVGEDRGAPFLAMEFLEGEPLDERLKRAKILPLRETLRIGREVAEGLAAAHERGLIHRDIKPGNIWLEGKRGRVKILDFGLARAAAGDDAHLTQSGAILGTPAYMAPEQARAEAVDARCDLFSLGCVLYQLCTGQTPFKGSDAMSMMLALVMDEPKPPRELNPQVPPALSDLILKLLAKDREKRPTSAQTVVDALQALEKEQPLPAPAVPALPTLLMPARLTAVAKEKPATRPRAGANSS